MDGFQEILYTLRQNKLRTLLTAFGVFWGIFMLIILLGAGKGLQNGVYKTFGSDVLDFIIVYTGTTSIAHQGMGVGRRIEFTLADVEAIKRQLPNLRFAAAEVQMSGVNVSYENKSGSYALYGIPDEYFKIKESIPFTLGRVINPLDQQQVRKVCVVGTVVAERLFGEDSDPVGRNVTINGVVMKVVGVFYDDGNRGADSERIYIPYTTYRKVFAGGDKIGSIWLRPQLGKDGLLLEQQVLDLLRARHGVAAEDRRAIRSFNMAEPAQMVSGLFMAINGFIWFVGLGTLAAGIVGVSNIMIITVKERTREIGIRKALGATPAKIISTLLLESVLVTSLAGYGGLVLGVALLELVSVTLNSSGTELTFFQNPEVNFEVAITAIILLVSVGALAGLVPALKAARIVPTEAMRAE